MAAAAIALLGSVAAILGFVRASHDPAVARPVGGVRVAGARLVNAAGSPVQLGGVSVSGTEYECLNRGGVFAGPSSASAVGAMDRWHIDIVRIPINEDCWLGINGLPSGLPASSYRAAIEAFVTLLQRRRIVVDLDLHWSAPANVQARSQQRMPDADHSVAFWRQVASTYGNDPYVVFELYNEPYGVSWSCWRDGCTTSAEDGRQYQAVGMQSLVHTIRGAGAKNVLFLDGLSRGADLSQWSVYRPADPDRSIAAAWHIYGPQHCASSCWTRQLSQTGTTPVAVTEFGETDCRSAYVRPLMSWLDARRIGYLAWAWNTWPGCHGPSLITDYSGSPHGAYGTAVMKHFQSHFPSPGS
ncbi:MAG TPA: cellulase family glycosylhydrolase [Acidimicrobiales bacterium]